jgi:hypothetical protein
MSDSLDKKVRKEAQELLTYVNNVRHKITGYRPSIVNGYERGKDVPKRRRRTRRYWN